MYSFVIRTRLARGQRGNSTRGAEGEGKRNGDAEKRRGGGESRLTAGRGLCAPRVISNVPGCRDSTLMERVALTPAFARQARRSSGVARASMPPSSTGANGSGVSPFARVVGHFPREDRKIYLGQTIRLFVPCQVPSYSRIINAINNS